MIFMPRRTLFLAVLLILLSSGAIAIAAISENTGVAYGGTAILTGLDGVCKKVTNNSPTGKQVYVPGSTSEEWQSFLANKPNGVELASCGCALPWGGTLAEGQSATAYQSASAPYGECLAETRTCSGGVLSGSYQYESCAQSCAGTPIGGYCWYAAGMRQSCSSFCASRGGWSETGCAYSVSDTNICKGILTTLGLAPSYSEWSTMWSSAYNGMGCFMMYHRNGAHYWARQSCSATAGDVSGLSTVRACSCNN